MVTANYIHYGWATPLQTYAAAGTSVDALPAGWKASQDHNGNQYYYNKELNLTQWSRPYGWATPTPIHVAPSVQTANSGWD